MKIISLNGESGVSRPKPFLLAMLLVFAVAGAVEARAQSTIFISRHEDRGPEEPDAALTAKGRCQAAALGALLADAGIKHVYTTEFSRTRDTAAPTAKRAGVTPVVVPTDEFDTLIARIRETAKPNESTLVVGHRSTVPKIVKALTGRDIEPLGSGEYTRLIVVTLLPDGKSSVITLRQGGGCD